MGQGFQSLGGVIIPLGDPVAAAQAMAQPAKSRPQFTEPPADQESAQPPVQPALPGVVPAVQLPARAPQPTTVVTGSGQLIKAARARLKELKAELKRMKLVQREHDELERLLKAAKKKPAKVQSLRSA